MPEEIVLTDNGWIRTTYCENCGQAIQIMINRGQNYCSENCKKELEAKNA